jgi:hypothetical protein
MTSAKLIAPAIEVTFAAGFDWCVFPNLNTRGRYRVNVGWSPPRQVMVILCGCFCRCVDMVKSSQYVELANDLEINKAITYLRQRDFNQVGVSVSPSLNSLHLYHMRESMYFFPFHSIMCVHLCYIVCLCIRFSIQRFTFTTAFLFTPSMLFVFLFSICMALKLEVCGLLFRLYV